MIEFSILIAFLIIKYGIPDLLAAQRGDTTSRTKDRAARQTSKALEIHARRQANLGPTVGQALASRLANWILRGGQPKPAKPPRPPKERGPLAEAWHALRCDIRDQATHWQAMRRMDRLNEQRQRDGLPIIDVEVDEPDVEPEHWCASCGVRPVDNPWNKCPGCALNGEERFGDRPPWDGWPVIDEQDAEFAGPGPAPAAPPAGPTCVRCAATPVARDFDLCPLCALDDEAERWPDDPIDPATPEPTPVPEPHQEGPIPVTVPAAQIISGDIGSPEQAVAFCEGNQQVVASAIDGLTTVIATLQGQGVGQEFLDLFGTAIEALDGAAGAVDGARDAYINHVEMQLRLLGDERLRDALQGWLART